MNEMRGRLKIEPHTSWRSGEIVKSFRHSNGTVIEIGHDHRLGTPNDRMICWNDPNTGSWEMSLSNQAGSWITPDDTVVLAPKDISETPDGVVIIHQDVHTIEIYPVGMPFVWGFRIHNYEERAA
jgi:hypothetical protein